MSTNDTPNKTPAKKQRASSSPSKQKQNKNLPKGLYQVNERFYWTSFTINGQREKLSTNTCDLEQALAIHAERQAEHKKRKLYPEFYKKDQVNKTTLGECFDLYKAHNANNDTLSDVKTRMNRVFTLIPANTKLSDISRADVLNLRLKLQSVVSDVTNKPLSPATVNRHIEILKATLNVGVSMERLKANPAANIGKLKENNLRNKVVKPEMLVEMLKHPLMGRGVTLAVQIGYYTGMRLGEIAEMSWDRVDLQNRMFVLRDIDTKTNEPRTVPIKDELFELLTSQPDAQGEAHTYAVNAKKLVCGRSDAYITKTFTKVARALKYNVTFHSMRHGFVTRGLDAGVDVVSISQITGHKSLEMLKRYDTVSDARKLNVVNRF